MVDLNGKILHICSNYVGTKIFPNLLKELNLEYGNNFLFCPVKKNSTKEEKYRYLKSDDNIFNENESFAQICHCFSKTDTLLFFPKRKKIYEAIQRSFEVSDFKVIIAHSLFTDGWVAYKLKKKYNIPYSVFVQNSDINVFFRIPGLKRWGEKILSEAQKIIFCSEIIKDGVLKKYISSKNVDNIKNKTTIIPFGIEAIFFEELYRNERSLVAEQEINILSVGTIDRNKNQLIVAQAIDSLNNLGTNIRYYLVGKVVDKKYFQKILKYSFVEYLGVKNYKELINVYRECDMMVLASIHETFGLVYAEAMTQALPVLYSSGQGFDGQFQDGQVGYAVNSKDYKDIANKIELAIENYSCLSNQARELSKKFSWKNVAKQYYCVALETC